MVRTLFPGDIRHEANAYVDAYVPSQLIMISPDLLAQYWVNMGHISYYRRVDLDGVISSTFGDCDDRE